nr:MAG TPA: hypothetical protein [Caudoviricetes sp.]
MLCSIDFFISSCSIEVLEILQTEEFLLFCEHLFSAKIKKLTFL